jgi:hypothetical protein
LYCVFNQKPEESGIFPTILSFTDLKDIPSISSTCRIFNDTMNRTKQTAQTYWKRLATTKNPDLARIFPLCTEIRLNADEPCGGWKLLLQRKKTYMINYGGKYGKLAESLEMVFRDQGILPFLYYYEGSAKYMGYTPYDWTDVRIRRRHGIRNFGVKFSKKGVRMLSNQQGYLEIWYHNYHYLMENWESECEFIKRWFDVWGLKNDAYTIPAKNSIRQREIKFGVQLHFDLNEVDPDNLHPPDRSDAINSV